MSERTSTTLGEIAEIISGSTPKSNISDYWNGDITWATPTDLSKLENKEIITTARLLTQQGLESCSAKLLPPNSVLFTSRAPIGHVAINKVAMATNQGFKSFIPDTKKVDQNYLYYWLKSKKDYLQHLGRGATFKEVSKQIVASIPITLPSLDEQRRIAKILDKINSIDQKIARKLQLLNKISLSSRHKINKRAIEQGNGSIEELGNILKVKSGSFLPKSKMEAGSIPVYGGNGLSGTHNMSMYQERKLIIGRVGFYCGCVHITNDCSWITDNALIVENLSEKVDFDFLRICLEDLKLNQFANSSAQPQISGSKIYPIKVFIPDMKVQIKLIQIQEKKDFITKLLHEMKLKSKELNTSLNEILINH